MAPSKQAFFPARIANPLGRGPNNRQNRSKPKSSNQHYSHTDTGLDTVSNPHPRSPSKANSDITNVPAFPAPRPPRIYKHARKSSSNLFAALHQQAMAPASRGVSDDSMYAPSEGTRVDEDEDEESLFVPLGRATAGSPDFLGGVMTGEEMGFGGTRQSSVVAEAVKENDMPPPPSWGWTSAGPGLGGAVAPVAEMISPSTPIHSSSRGGRSTPSRASIPATVLLGTIARLSPEIIKPEAGVGNHHSLPDLSAKLTSVITVSTCGLRGGDSKIVTMHVAMLEDKSPFLIRLAESSPSPDISLLELDCNAFSKFAAWVYGGRFEFDTCSADLGDVLDSVLECYTLALKLEAPGFANAVLAKACKVSAERGLVFRNDIVNAMFARTHRGSKMRKWIVDEWVWQFDAEGMSEVSWSTDRVLEKEIVFEMFQVAGRRLGKGRQKHQSPREMAESYRIAPGQDIVALD